MHRALQPQGVCCRLLSTSKVILIIQTSERLSELFLCSEYGVSDWGSRSQVGASEFPALSCPSGQGRSRSQGAGISSLTGGAMKKNLLFDLDLDFDQFGSSPK